jgi:hypothetical protein
MKAQTSAKQRRSKRASAKNSLMLTIHGPEGEEVVKEIVTTIELSLHGARVRGLRTLQPGWRGVLVELRSLRQAPFQVAWQTKAAAGKGYLDTGVELLEELDFWKEMFSNASTEQVPGGAVEKNALSPEELLQEMVQWPVFQSQPGSPTNAASVGVEPGVEESREFLHAVWCALVEQLEERKVFTRAELVAGLRKIAQAPRV